MRKVRQVSNLSPAGLSRTPPPSFRARQVGNLSYFRCSVRACSSLSHPTDQQPPKITARNRPENREKVREIGNSAMQGVCAICGSVSPPIPRGRVIRRDANVGARWRVTHNIFAKRCRSGKDSGLPPKNGDEFPLVVPAKIFPTSPRVFAIASIKPPASPTQCVCVGQSPSPKKNRLPN